MERRVIQEFIEIYRNEQSLWKVRSAYYNNKAVKGTAYRRMMSKLREIYPEADIEMVKRKINALRTNYRKELRKVLSSRERQNRTGEPVYIPSLWYYDLFHFIADQEGEQQDQSTTPPVIDVADEPSVIDVQDILRVKFEENLEFEAEFSDEFEEEVESLVSSPDGRINSTQLSSLSESSSKRRRTEGAEDPQWYTMKSYNGEARSSTTPLTSEEVFGRYVSSKLSQMDRPNQMLAERLISEVLFRGQMELLTRRTTLRDEPLSVKVEEDTTQ